jgi:peptide chain release factor 1
MRARGAGGQAVNKIESAIRLTHIPTGLAVSMQDSRSQHENRRRAWQLLRAKIAEIRREAREAELVRLRRGILGGVAKTDRGDKIRTYNFGQNRCTDHRSGFTVHNLTDVLAGGPHLDKVMESARGWLVDQEIDTLHLEEELKSRNHGSKAGAKKKAS